ncbi:MAG: cytochrome c3 family protein [Acidobacteria bacterium]|nr:cytochrome c3 family protein [Acidobacteriota bacterium]
MLAGDRHHGWWILAACAALALALVATSTFVLIPARAEAQAGVGQPDTGAGSDSVLAADPDAQPIDFSHTRHVVRAGIECQFCHAYARRGPVAGIPPVERCAGCHRSILSERPEIERVLGYWEREEPIPWIRVHDLPDYVRFSHKAHIRAGVDCATCHGDVASMAIARQVESLSMGWCVDCHAEQEASRDCVICHY